MFAHPSTANKTILRKLVATIDIWQDLRYACRTVWRKRTFTLMATLMLMLAVGANAAIFSVVKTVLLRRLPYANAERVIWISNRNTTLGVNGAFLNPADILDYREQSQSFERIAAWGTLPLNLYGTRSPERVEGVFVTPNFFRTLGVRPTLGRDFAERDEPENSVIISHGLWLRQFGGDPAVIGKNISFGMQPMSAPDSNPIVGVLPADVNFPVNVDLFTPTELIRLDNDRGGSHNWRTIGRLKAGVGIEQAQNEINGLAQRQSELYPETNRGWQIQLQSLREHLFGNAQGALLLLFGAVATVLVIACANIGNLQLGRVYGMRRELAVRLALGAGRFRIVRQFIIENLLISLVGGAFGIVIASAILSAVRTIGPQSVPRLKEVALDWTTFWFALGVSLFSSIMFGLVPALQASRSEINDALKNSQGLGTTARRSNRVRGTLVVGQVALAMLLLTVAGLVIKSFWRLQSVDPGMKTEGLVSAGLSVSFGDYPNGSPKRTQLFRDAIERLKALPGVVSVGAISHLPLGGRTMQLPFRIVGQQGVSKADERVADYRVVTPSFFQTVGIGLKKGRMFDEHDRKGTTQVFLVNEAFARTFLSGVEPVGVRLEGDSNLAKGEIVGIVANVKHKSLELDSEPAFYVSYEQSSTFPIMNFVVRTQTDVSSLILPVRRELEALDPRAVVFNVKPLDQFVADSQALRRFNLWLFTVFGLLAAVLATTGVYATVNFAVAQRNREIGIRMALGAQKSEVMKLIFGEGALLIGTGLLIGLAGSVALNRWLTSLLFSVTAIDPSTHLIMGGMLICAALIATWIPARQAAKVNPIQTLRSE